MLYCVLIWCLLWYSECVGTQSAVWNGQCLMGSTGWGWEETRQGLDAQSEETICVYLCVCVCVFQSFFDVLYIVWSRNQSQLFSIQIVLLLQLVWKSVCERLPEFHWSLCHKLNYSLGKTWCLNYCGLSSDFCFASVFILFIYIFMYFLELSWTCFHRCLCAPTKHTCHTVSWDFDLYFIYPFREELASL